MYVWAKYAIKISEAPAKKPEGEACKHKQEIGIYRTWLSDEASVEQRVDKSA